MRLNAAGVKGTDKAAEIRAGADPESPRRFQISEMK